MRDLDKTATVPSGTRRMVDRIMHRLFVGSGPDTSFLIRHDWAIPVVVLSGCGGFVALIVLAIIQGWAPTLMWIVIAIGLVSVLLTIPTFVHLHRATRGPLPALDRTPRTARVVLNADDADGGQTILVEYRGADGVMHSAQLADIIEGSHQDRFTPNSCWQVYAFRDVAHADTVVFLTQTHDDVWRAGWKLDGVRIGGESGPIKPGPGSPFLREDSTWEFTS